MGKSFLLRDLSGAVRGYLVQGMGKLRCRADAPAAEGQLVLLFADGAFARHALRAGGAEQTLKDGGREITGAVVCAGDEPLLRTDERASAAYAQLSCRKEGAGQAPARRKALGNQQEETQGEGQEEKEEQITADRTEAQEAARAPSGETEGAGSLPQGRWPPPACWPGAQYVHGRWQERAE